MDKTSSGGAKRRYNHKLKWIIIQQDTCGKKCKLFLFFFCLMEQIKKKKKKNHFKNRKIYFPPSISPSFDELHCLPIVHLKHKEPMFQDLPFYYTKIVPKYHNTFYHFLCGGGTHFQVLAQNLIYTLPTWALTRPAEFGCLLFWGTEKCHRIFTIGQI